MYSVHQIARALGVPRHWIDKRISTGKVKTESDPEVGKARSFTARDALQLAIEREIEVATSGAREINAFSDAFSRMASDRISDGEMGFLVAYLLPEGWCTATVVSQTDLASFIERNRIAGCVIVDLRAVSCNLLSRLEENS